MIYEDISYIIVALYIKIMPISFMVFTENKAIYLFSIHIML